MNPTQPLGLTVGAVLMVAVAGVRGTWRLGVKAAGLGLDGLALLMPAPRCETLWTEHHPETPGPHQGGPAAP